MKVKFTAKVNYLLKQNQIHAPNGIGAEKEEA
jgi:hypothetical protein